MASNQLAEVPTDQRNLVESLGDLSIGKEQGFTEQTAPRPRSGLARTSSTASSASDASQGDQSGKPLTEKLAEQVKGDAEVTDGRVVAGKPPSGILQSVTGKISQTVQSAKDAISKKREQTKPAATKEGDEDVLVLDEEYTKKVADEVNQPSATKDALASAGAAVVGSAVAAKDAVVASVSAPGEGEGSVAEGGAAPAKGGILHTVGTKIAQSAQYVKEVLVTGKPAAEGDAAEGTEKGVLGKVGEKVTQSAQYVKESVQAKTVTDPANPEKVDVQQTAKSVLQTVGEKVSQGTAYVRDVALTRAGPYSQGPVDTAPETGLVNPSSVGVTDSTDLPEEPVAQSTQAKV